MKGNKGYSQVLGIRVWTSLAAIILPLTEGTLFNLINAIYKQHYI